MNASEASRGRRASLDELIDSVADGDDIDWTALEADADPDILRLLAMVKTVAGVALVHRTPLEEEETGPVPSPLPGSAAVPLGELGRWGHLQLVRKVGEGAYGEVFHARDTWLDHPVALKLLRPELTDRVAPTKLLDEARAGAKSLRRSRLLPLCLLLLRSHPCPLTLPRVRCWRRAWWQDSCRSRMRTVSS